MAGERRTARVSYLVLLFLGILIPILITRGYEAVRTHSPSLSPGDRPLETLHVDSVRTTTPLKDEAQEQRLLALETRQEKQTQLMTSLLHRLDGMEKSIQNVVEIGAKVAARGDGSSGDAETYGRAASDEEQGTKKRKSGSSSARTDRVEGEETAAQAPDAAAAASKHDVDQVLTGLAPGTTVTVTFADSRFEDMMRNFILNVQKAGISNVLVGTMDEEATAICKRMHDRCFFMTENFKNFGYGVQVPLLKHLLGKGYHVLLSDVDTVWLKNPMPYFEETALRRAADVLSSTDCPGHEVMEKGDAWHSSFNIGIMLWRATDKSRKLVDEWLEGLAAEGKGHVGYMREQHVLNEVVRGKDNRELWPLRTLDGVNERDPEAVVHAHTVDLGLLRVESFAHGHIYFVARIPQALKMPVYVVHATYQFGGYEGKRNRFREGMLWLADGEEYYTGKYVTYPSYVPPDVINGTDPLVEAHMRVAAFHHRNMQAGFALARALGRILIMPELLCFCDTHWTIVTPECRMGYSDLTLPFTCPLDHMVDTSRFKNSGVEYREYSFLSNPRTPDRVKESRATIRVIERDGQFESSVSGGVPTVRWPAFASDKEAARRIAAAKLDDVHILEVDKIDEALCGFESAEDSREFNGKMAQLLGGLWWCCEQDPTYKQEIRQRPRQYKQPEPMECKAAVGGGRRGGDDGGVEEVEDGA